MDVPEGFSDAVGTGSRRVALEALRRKLALTIEDAKPGEVAALARQLTIVLEQLAALPAAEEATPLDDLTARRAARRGAASQAL